MDIQAIQAFLSVSETGSFSRAADALFLTQPAVSKRISSLEHALGVALFDRIGKSVRLTEAGHALIPSCRRIIAEIAESERIISNLRTTTSGVLSIATSHHIGLHRLPPVLRDFSKRYPEVELKLGFMDSEQACQQILNGETELAIVTLPDEENDRLDTIPVWHDPLYIVVARQHPLSSQKRVSIHQLQAYPAILPSTGTYTRKLIDNALGLEGPVRTLLETHYLETIKAMVKTGLGWSMLPASMLDQGLSVLNIKRIQTIRQLGIIVHSMRTKSNAANAMIDQLLNYADG